MLHFNCPVTGVRSTVLYTRRMAHTPKPPQFQVKPGENVWDALAREVATDSDSPISLRLQSLFNQSLGPRTRASDQLVAALADLLERPQDASAIAAVDAAIAYWEEITGTKLDEQRLEHFRRDGEERAAQRRRQPPSIESIVEGIQERSDIGYDLGVHLHGLRGTWHRLWAIIAMTVSFGDDPDNDEGVSTVRGQFERLLGRPLAPVEWEPLLAHARRHAETNMPRPGNAGGS